MTQECGVRQTRNTGAEEGSEQAVMEPQHHNALRGPLAEEEPRLTWLHAAGLVAF